MSEHLLSRYRPVADALLHLHDLTVSSSTRDMLAKTIMQSRVLPDRSSSIRSPLPAFRKANVYTRRLLRYLDGGRSKPGDAAKTRKLLTQTLNSNVLISIELATGTPSVDITTLTVRPRKASFTRRKLNSLLIAIDSAIRAKRRSGPLSGRAVRMVNGAYIAWRMAGKQCKFRWNPYYEKRPPLTGKIVAFTRDVEACCLGRHALVHEAERTRKPSTPSKRKPLTDNYLRVLLDRIQCSALRAQCNEMVSRACKK